MSETRTERIERLRILFAMRERAVADLREELAWAEDRAFSAEEELRKAEEEE